MDWAKTRGRAVLSFLSDLGGALAFVTLAVGLIVAAVTGAALLAWTALPQPFFALLVMGIAMLAAGLVLHFLRGPLTPPVRPQRVQAAAEAADNPYSRAALLQRQHDEEKGEEAEREEVTKIRRATRRIREELLDNDHAIQRLPHNLEELLAIRFEAWKSEQSTLMDQDDPTPHQLASAAYREIQGLLRGRVGENELDGSPYVYGDTPDLGERDHASKTIHEAVRALV